MKKYFLTILLFSSIAISAAFAQARQAQSYFDSGNTALEKNDYNKAIADFTQAIRIDPSFVNAYINRAFTYNNKGDYDKAIADCNEAIRLDPKDSISYNNRGYAYLNKRDYDKAIADFTQAIRLNSKNEDNYFNRGVAYYEKKDYDKAIADYTQAIRLNSKYTEAYLYRSYAYHSKGDDDKAIADLEAALRLKPNDAEIKRTLEAARYDQAPPQLQNADAAFFGTWRNQNMSYTFSKDKIIGLSFYDKTGFTIQITNWEPVVTRGNITFDFLKAFRITGKITEMTGGWGVGIKGGNYYQIWYMNKDGNRIDMDGDFSFVKQ